MPRGNGTGPKGQGVGTGRDGGGRGQGGGFAREFIEGSIQTVDLMDEHFMLRKGKPN